MTARGRDLLKVVARIRPLFNDEPLAKIHQSAPNAITVSCPGTAVRTAAQEKHFKYDVVLGPEASQEDVYRNVGMPMLRHTLQGYNTCIFAYGQTGSGKTYSLQGQSPMGSARSPEAGLVSRICRDMFSQFVDMLEENSNLSIKVVLTYYEIYNEMVIDLLQPRKSGSEITSLEVRQDADHRAYIVGLSTHTVLNYESVMRLLKVGANNRQIANTKMNKSSSRSHSVLQFQIIQTVESNDSYQRDLESIMTVVDLAGSERLSATDDHGIRAEESMQINKSLFTLGRTLNALADGKAHIPIRDSKLTRLLSDNFGGNARTIMLATITPCATSMGESLSTLGFAQHAGAIKQCAKVNRKERYLESRHLQQQVEALRRQLKDQEIDYEEKLLIRDLRIKQLEEAAAKLDSTPGTTSPSPGPLDFLGNTEWHTYSQRLLDLNSGLDIDETEEDPSSYTTDLSAKVAEQEQQLEESRREVLHLREIMLYKGKCHEEMYRRLADVTQSFREAQADAHKCRDRTSRQQQEFCMAWGQSIRALQDTVALQEENVMRLQHQKIQLGDALHCTPCSNTQRVLQHQLGVITDTANMLHQELQSKRNIIATMMKQMEMATPRQRYTW